MRKLIADILVGDRFRRDLGDLSTLAESIKIRGLINPITIDAGNNLIAGHRRLEALKLLGELAADVRVIDTLGDAIKAIEIERDENTERKPMTGGELSALAARLAELASIDARRRQRLGTRQPEASPGLRFGKAAIEVGKALGVGKSTAQDLIAIGKAAQSDDADVREAGRQAQAGLDAGAGVQGTASKMRAKINGTPVPPPLPRPSVDVKRQDKLWANLAQQARGLADAIPHLSAQGRPQDAEEAARWARDLRKLRTVISQTIDLLESRVPE